MTDFLMIPEYLLYKLCGAKSHEYTNATTGGMVSAVTGEFDSEIISIPFFYTILLYQRFSINATKY